MTAPAAERDASMPRRLAVPEAAARKIPKINPVTGLSTDYLNHFTEAVMLLEMGTTMPDCLDDLRAWRPKTYASTSPRSRFTDRDAVIAAYDAADPAVRDALDCASQTLNNVLVEARDVVCGNLATPDADALAQRAVAWCQAADRARRRASSTAPRSPSDARTPRRRSTRCSPGEHVIRPPRLSRPPDPGRQRRHHPRRPRVGRPPRARPRARRVDHAGRRGRGRRNAERSADPRNPGGNLDDDRAGRAGRPPRGGGARRRPAGCRAISSSCASPRAGSRASRSSTRNWTRRAGCGPRSSRASRPPRASTRSSPRRSSGWKPQLNGAQLARGRPGSAYLTRLPCSNAP